MRKFIIAALAAAGLAAATAPTDALAAGGETKIIDRDWTWEGVFGHFDKAQLRRGFQVYRDVCASCHGLKQIRYRELAEIGLTEEEIKDYASMYEYQDGYDDMGEPKFRPGIPADRLKDPFPNEQAARFANGGALPPDLSLITKARANGADYLYTLLIAYEEPPEGVELMPGMYYNPAFPGHQIAMPQMIYDDGVAYEDPDAPTTKEAISADVTAFLMWAAEPDLENRKSMGVKVMLFLIVMTALFYALKKQIWKRVEH